MLLRRVIEHVKAQNWTAVALDFCIVVVGVFIGIQVANWNADRALNKRAEQSLIELRNDFTAIDGAAAELAEFYEGLINDLEGLVRAIDDGKIDPDNMDTIKAALAYGDVFADPPPPSGTFRDLESSGNLTLIRNRDLRLRLIEYDQSLDNILASDANINTMLVPFSAAFKRHVIFNPDYHLPETSDLAFQDVHLPEVSSVNVEAILSDSEFMVAAQQHLRLQIGRYINIRVSQSKINQIREMIDQELESR